MTGKYKAISSSHSPIYFIAENDSRVLIGTTLNSCRSNLLFYNGGHGCRRRKIRFGLRAEHAVEG